LIDLARLKSYLAFNRSGKDNNPGWNLETF